jgi:ATP-binding cassette, subfamily C (CFTR/MRP), member 2
MHSLTCTYLIYLIIKWCEQVRYRPNTPLVLKGVSLTIEGGEKVGVVGRTGSGKSTLIQVLFRLIEPSAGKIIIDGINISNVGLHDLRSRFGIIPQEPVLFQGTVRTNIDPLGLYSEEEIWKVYNTLHICLFVLFLELLRHKLLL